MFKNRNTLIKNYMKKIKDNKNVVIIILIILFIFIIWSIIKYQEKKELKARQSRDLIKVELLKNFFNKSLETSIKVVWLYPFQTANYMFKVENALTLKEYFIEKSYYGWWKKYDELIKEIKEDSPCYWNKDIFKVKNLKDKNWTNYPIYYIWLCLESPVNYHFHWKNDNWFSDKYYELYLWDWTKDEAMEWYKIETVDYTKWNLYNVWSNYEIWKDKWAEYRNTEKEKFVTNFIKSWFKSDFYWLNKKWPFYYFFVNNENDLRKFFSYYSGDAWNNDTLENFLKYNKTWSCNWKDNMYKFKETHKWRSIYDMNWVKTYKQIYIGICLEDSENKDIIWKSDDWFFNDYLEIIVWDWTKEEILGKKK